MGAGQHLRSTSALQPLQRFVRHRLAAAQLDRSPAIRPSGKRFAVKPSPR
jgi:hypothetical protein